MIIAPLLLIRFIHSYVLDKELPLAGTLLVLIAYVIPIYSLSYSNLFISNAWIQDAKLHFTAGIFYDYFVIGGIASIFSAIIVLGFGFKKRRGLNRVRFVYIATGIFLWLTFIGTFTMLLRYLGLPEYNFVAPIGCTLATAVWSIGIFKIDLFELPESAIINENNSLVAQANVIILKKVDSQVYHSAKFYYRKRIIQNIVGEFTKLQINSDLTVDEIFDRLAL